MEEDFYHQLQESEVSKVQILWNDIPKQSQKERMKIMSENLLINKLKEL
jgi:hypothetical protein